MTALGPLNEAAQAGFAATCIASAVIPAGWTTAGLMLPAIGDPDALLEAGLEWLDVGKELWAAADANIALTNSVGRYWRGEDADLFTAKAADLSQALMFASIHSYTVGAALIAASAAVAVVCGVIIAMGIGFTMHAYAVVSAIAAAAGTLGLGTPAVVAAMAAANAYAVSCTANLTSIDGTLTKLYWALAGGLGAALAGNIAAQVNWANNDAAMEDLLQATVLGLPTMAAGLTSAFFTKGLGGAMGAGGPLVRGLGGVLGTTGVDPVGELTEDADPTRWGDE